MSEASRTRRIRRGAGALAAAALLSPALLTASVVQAPGAQADTWRDAQFWLEDYGITEAWETTRGEGVTIAIIDTGIDAEHPGLEGALVGGTDVSGGGDADGGPVQQTSTEHGTLVASLAAGRGEYPSEDDEDAVYDMEPEELQDLSDEEWDAWWDENMVAPLEETYGEDWEDEVQEDFREELEEFYETREVPDWLIQDFQSPEDDEDEDDDEDPSRSAGVIGVAPEAELLSISLALEDPNPYGPGTEDQIPEAVTWAVDNGADIINMSLGSGAQDWPESWDEAFLYAEENDVLVVAAAGNRAAGHFSVGAPATIPGVLTVAGVDEDRNISEDSSSQGIAIDIAAASEPLVGATPGGGYAGWTGTSGAAPIVAGAAALVMAAHPDLSAAEVKHRLLTSADSAGSSGLDPEYGHGVLNVDEAVNGSVPAFNAADYDTLAEWIRVHRRAEAEDNGHEDIPTDSGVVAGPEGEPREFPQASELRAVQDWAGPTTVAAAGLGVVVLLTVAVVHLASRTRRN
ncbi:S8 family peptidase [Nesterenkonia flava]|uniref:S8 family serine peptidase n=1 Tax=Nesterenkonia flava TaxID=469799 RepID=A0ABU1FQ95_9MICC|nr:S8 family serine peptidase [Nesterenkonia flava]MDR5710825.1 S8 family serine peptidase [Nesterenkonia flava]